MYVPNGASVGTDKYQYKLAWLAAVTAFIKQQIIHNPQLVVMGDFNIAPDDRDVHDPALWEGGILVSPDERKAFNVLLDVGLEDSFRMLPQNEARYSWWDYRAGGFRRNNGLRIDLVLLSQALRSQCLESDIDVEPRRADRPSDHAPVWVVLRTTA